MSKLGNYTFLPWLREGLANQIDAPDLDPAVVVRPQIQVGLSIDGQRLDGGTESANVTRTVSLYGPGDIVGIDERMIVRTDPHNWAADYEPNYLPQIEFYDEDFPWRYTPAAPAFGRIRPWLTLIVLSEEEFSDGINQQGRPLPFIVLEDLGVLPRPDELWAWAHVHVNASLIQGADDLVSTEMSSVIPKLESVLGNNADHAYSRLVCPRKLSPQVGYHAFLVPTFEVGRRAGLGLEVDGVMATASAWEGDRPEGAHFPFYYRWYFRTGRSGDFESLVRLLKPAIVNPRVGRREMDVQHPGSNVAGVDNPALQGILQLGGALQPPLRPPDIYDTWDEPYPRPLQQDLAGLVNLPDDYRRKGDPDPMIAPPIYGQWHALRRRLLVDENGDPVSNDENWLHRLNLDPRHRVAAGLGTRVIQKNQESLMDAAWEQVGSILEAQSLFRLSQLSVATSEVWFDKHFSKLAAGSSQRALMRLGPVQKRVLINGKTLHHSLRSSRLSSAATSTTLRRILRPGSRTVRRAGFSRAMPVTQLLERVASGEVSPSLPPPEPKVSTYELLAQNLEPKNVPAPLRTVLRSQPNLPVTARRALTGLGIASFAVPLVGPLIGAAGLIASRSVPERLGRWQARMVASDSLQRSELTPQSVERWTTRSDEEVRLKSATRESFDLLDAGWRAGTTRDASPVVVKQLADQALMALHPRKTIPKRVANQIKAPAGVLAQLDVAMLITPMAYPVIDLPMYEPLVEMGTELFLPNINLIEQNTVTLLETNQPFIEAYMVGLNHEFARELLWREFPTDQRGTPFRQFWDVSSLLDRNAPDLDALREELRDIPPLHEWSGSSSLGQHDHREKPGDEEQELVLVIRGELLKRYPNAVIYAHRACWQRKGTGAPGEEDLDPCLRGGDIDPKQERRLAPLTPAEEEKPPFAKVRTPLYEAKVDPDIYFLGFDLTAEDAIGGTGENQSDDPGWFFVIRERPGEPRFGLDIDQQPALHVFNDLAWQDIQPGPEGSYIEIDQSPGTITLAEPGTIDQEKKEQHEDDVKVTWHHGMSSAEIAYVLFQSPVLVAVHASEMLPKGGTHA